MYLLSLFTALSVMVEFNFSLNHENLEAELVCTLFLVEIEAILHTAA